MQNRILNHSFLDAYVLLILSAAFNASGSLLKLSFIQKNAPVRGHSNTSVFHCGLIIDGV